MTKFTNKQVEIVFRFYPDGVRRGMLDLRELVLDVARELEVFQKIEETLKWGEPSYRVPGGSPVRMDWKEQDPEFFRLFFNCQTSLIGTFREEFPELEFEGNRAIRLKVGEAIDREKMTHCLRLAFRYHSE